MGQVKRWSETENADLARAWISLRRNDAHLARSRVFDQAMYQMFAATSPATGANAGRYSTRSFRSVYQHWNILAARVLEAGSVAPSHPITEAWRLLTPYAGIGSSPTAEQDTNEQHDSDDNAKLKLPESVQDLNSEPTVTEGVPISENLRDTSGDPILGAGEDAWHLFEEILAQGSEEDRNYVFAYFNVAVASFKETMVQRGLNFEMTDEERRIVVQTVSRNIFGYKPSSTLGSKLSFAASKSSN